MLIVALAATIIACARKAVVVFEPSGTPLTVRRASLYPETIAYNERRDRFLLGSFREGAIYEVDGDGGVSQLVSDPRLCSVLGIAVDAERVRLWAVSSDLGAPVWPSAAGPKTLAAVGIYDLGTRRSLDYIDLAPLSPDPHLLNGIALDASGNAYITDKLLSHDLPHRAGRRGVGLSLEQGVRRRGRQPEWAGRPPRWLFAGRQEEHGALFRVPLAELRATRGWPSQTPAWEVTG